MLRFVLRRMLSMVLVMFAISVLVFLIFFATPASIRLRASQGATPTSRP